MLHKRKGNVHLNLTFLGGANNVSFLRELEQISIESLSQGGEAGVDSYAFLYVALSYQDSILQFHSSGKLPKTCI